MDGSRCGYCIIIITILCAPTTIVAEAAQSAQSKLDGAKTELRLLRERTEATSRELAALKTQVRGEM